MSLADPLTRLAEQLDRSPRPDTVRKVYEAERAVDAQLAYQARLVACRQLVDYLGSVLDERDADVGGEDWGDVGDVGLALTHLHRAAEAFMGPDPDGEDVAVARLILNGHGA